MRGVSHTLMHRMSAASRQKIAGLDYFTSLGRDIPIMTARGLLAKLQALEKPLNGP